MSWVLCSALTPLNEYSQRDRNKEAMSVARSLEHFGVTGTVMCISLCSQSLCDLHHLVVDQGRVFITVGVPLFKQYSCFFYTVVRDQPARRLWCPDETRERQDWDQDLEDRWDAPRCVALHIPSTKCLLKQDVYVSKSSMTQKSSRSTYNESSDHASDIPSTHEQCIGNAAVSRVRDLIDEQWHRAGEASGRTTHEKTG
jgi:hypothetical protein